MDSETLMIVVCLMFLGVVILVTLLLSGRTQKENRTANQSRLEFSKQIMLTLLAMWVLGGLVGIWVVMFRDYTFLDKLQSYVSYPVTAGIGCYTAKSGAENLKKMSPSYTSEEIFTEQGHDFESMNH